MITLFVVFFHISFKNIVVVKRIQLCFIIYYRYIHYVTNMNDFSKNYFYDVSLNLIRLIINHAFI